MSEPRAVTAAAGPRRWGYLAEFDSVDALLAAVEKVRDAGLVRFDAYAPFPVHGLDESMGLRTSRLPLVVLGGGIAGAAAALVMQWWMNAFDYRYIISGKPFFGLPVAIPITFELTILLAAVGGFLGLWVANRLPELYHPVFASARFRARATTDSFFVAVQADDPKFDAAGTRLLLEVAGARQVEEVEDE
ncbi:MAG: DUF3341 domain-containing protein [Thermoanaerobaculaceae bacterium]|nr:DUF3341 domain-containing protein [Thermoanaerobaculaceae bacterium]TAM48319.1 MAG: DUF3341 domain-containing protein [Acidobacteriota bacterium]